MKNSKYIVRNKITENLSKIFLDAKCPYSDVYIWNNPELDYDILHCAIPNTDQSFSFIYVDNSWHLTVKCRDKWNLGICDGLNRTYPNCIERFRKL